MILIFTIEVMILRSLGSRYFVLLDTALGARYAHDMYIKSGKVRKQEIYIFPSSIIRRGIARATLNQFVVIYSIS